MSLRRKTFIAIITTLITLVVILFVVSQSIILRQFNLQQEDAINISVARARYAVEQQIDSLSIISNDWAYWDDTYQFVQTGSPTYINLNLADSTLENLQLDFMLFVNKSGEVVYAKSLNHDAELNALTTQPELMQRLLDMPTDWNINSGFVELAQHVTLVASRNILNSRLTSSPEGVLIIGRIFDQDIISQMNQQTQLAVSVTPLDMEYPTDDYVLAHRELTSAQPPSIVYRLRDQSAIGYALLNDITGQPSAMLQIQTRNRIYQAGQQAVFYILLALLLSGAVFGIVILWLVDRLIISRLAYMDRRIFEIGNTNDFSARLVIAGNDELARLGSTINDFFAKREQSQEQQLKDMNATLTSLNAELNEKITELRNNQKYKDRFFAHASHEFRTPLSILRTRLYLARRKPEQWEAHLDALEDTLEHLINIIDDIFDLTRLSDHKTTLNLQPVDLKTFTDMMIQLDVARVQKPPQRICSDFAPDPFPVMVDHANFARAYEKTMKYMTDFSPPDAEIRVTLKPQQVANESHVLLSMTSRGLHIDAAQMPDMFSPFFQASEGQIRNTGLNLAIARQIVQLHGGTLTAQNDQQGGGFVFNLPLIPDKQPSTAAPVSVM